MRNPRIRRVAILATLWTCIAVILIFFRFVLLPFGLAVLLSFIIEPIVAAMTRRRIRGRTIPRIGAVLGIYVLVGLLGWLFGSWAVGQIGRELGKVGVL